MGMLDNFSSNAKIDPGKVQVVVILTKENFRSINERIIDKNQFLREGEESSTISNEINFIISRYFNYDPRRDQ